MSRNKPEHVHDILETRPGSKRHPRGSNVDFGLPHDRHGLRHSIDIVALVKDRQDFIVGCLERRHREHDAQLADPRPHVSVLQDVFDLTVMSYVKSGNRS